MDKQIIANEEFTSIQEAQAGLTRLLKKAAIRGNFYRVMKNNRPLGVLIPDNLWQSFLEDLEALFSQVYLENIRRARLFGKRYSAAAVKKVLGI